MVKKRATLERRYLERRQTESHNLRRGLDGVFVAIVGIIGLTLVLTNLNISPIQLSPGAGTFNWGFWFGIFFFVIAGIAGISWVKKRK